MSKKIMTSTEALEGATNMSRAFGAVYGRIQMAHLKPLIERAAEVMESADGYEARKDMIELATVLRESEDRKIDIIDCSTGKKEKT